MAATTIMNRRADKDLAAPHVPDAHKSGHGGGARTGASGEDKALVKQLLAGDEHSFAALVERYHGALIRLALAFVADRATAEEVVQETWRAVLTGLRSFEGRSSLKTWIFSILANKAKTRGVRERRWVPFSALVAADDEFAVDPARFTSAGMWMAPPDRWEKETPEQLLLHQETRTLVEHAIAELPPHQRSVITLRDVEGLASTEVCSLLEISETNQRVLLHRARSKLRTALETYLSASRPSRDANSEPKSVPDTRAHVEQHEHFFVTSFAWALGKRRQAARVSGDAHTEASLRR